MLVRSGRLPSSGDYSYEVRWDGFRAIVSTEGSLRARSRRGWDMIEHVLFLEQAAAHPWTVGAAGVGSCDSEQTRRRRCTHG
jgi:ATP-dependent DNA ligase